MGKKESDRLRSDEIIETLSSRITTARREAKRWKEYETAQVEELKAHIDGATDVIFQTEAGDEVVSITQTVPSVSYDYKAFFAAHPEHRAELEENFSKEGRSQIRVNTQWVSRN